LTQTYKNLIFKSIIMIKCKRIQSSEKCKNKNGEQINEN